MKNVKKKFTILHKNHIRGMQSNEKRIDRQRYKEINSIN